ncbi:MAG: DNA-processing protein DprA [Daejeonella sp.]|uniref:DNA-processing protein DprA n=1 Tax=Daejeonella sp. JGW-45 TaxID=3034148 RepID=UPI0023EE08A6|nr:DNA-processing protein DprA [Daejeonella sp. JGW-45]
MSVLHQIALSCITGIGSVLARNLISCCGSPEEVFLTRRKALSKIPGIGPKTVELIENHKAFERAEKELAFVEKYKIRTMFLTDDEYPKRLRNCFDAPVMMYFKGNADLNPSKVISVVGTRNSTDYGKDLCRQLLADLRVHNPLVISGLAYGIDFLAHREALKNSMSTIGIMAHGLDRIYPSQHRPLAEKMIAHGGLLTEFMSGTVPDRENFPKRNRIIAGLADVTIVVEANIKGGALITAELANSYNRDVFAYPGRVTDEYSSGCNLLIKTNRANLLTKVADLEYILGWVQSPPAAQNPQISLAIDLTDDERTIAGILLEKGNVDIDELFILSGLPQSRLMVNILGMEMRGLIVSLPGKVYKLA